jgi:hypothetical protein
MPDGSRQDLGDLGCADLGRLAGRRELVADVVRRTSEYCK